jgi:hypothetical protein
MPSINRSRDSLFESPKPDEYKDIFGKLINSSDFFGLPMVMAMHGDYGSGKTRLLKGIATCALQQGYPCTFFNTSQYDSEATSLISALLATMSGYYLRTFKGKESRAKIVGGIAGSIDTFLRLFGKDASILVAGDAIKTAIDAEMKQLIGEWIERGDPIESMKTEFRSMVSEVSIRKERKPWIILLDDLDRVLPDKALDLLIALRSILSVAPINVTESNTPGEKVEESNVSALFLIGLNLDSIRTAIKSRYSNLFPKQNEKDLDVFCEQFLRKLFLFGPQIPDVSEETITNSILTSIDSNRESEVIKKSAGSIAKLAVGSELPYRAILRSFDCVYFYYWMQNDSNIEEKHIIALFILEVIRFYSENTLKTILYEYRNDARAEPLAKIKECVIKNKSLYLNKLIKAYEKDNKLGNTIDPSIWYGAFNIAGEGVWKSYA